MGRGGGWGGADAGEVLAVEMGGTCWGRYGTRYGGETRVDVALHSAVDSDGSELLERTLFALGGNKEMNGCVKPSCMCSSVNGQVAMGA